MQLYIIMAISLFLLIFPGCHTENKAYVGEWEFVNISTVDSSLNQTSLLGTTLVREWPSIERLWITTDELVILGDHHTELYRGSCATTDNRISYTLSGDFVETHFKVMELRADTLLLSATNAGETLNMVLVRK